MMLSLIYYLCVIITFCMFYILITGFVSKDMDKFDKDCMRLITCKCDIYTFSLIFGLLYGPSMYAIKTGDLFHNSKFQIFAFWAGSIAGIFLGPIEYYKYITNHQNRWNNPEWLVEEKDNIYI